MTARLAALVLAAAIGLVASPALADMGCGPSPGYPYNDVDVVGDGSGSGDGSASLDAFRRTEVQRGFVSVIPAIVVASWLLRRRRAA